MCIRDVNDFGGHGFRNSSQKRLIWSSDEIRKETKRLTPNSGLDYDEQDFVHHSHEIGLVPCQAARPRAQSEFFGPGARRYPHRFLSARTLPRFLRCCYSTNRPWAFLHTAPFLRSILFRINASPKNCERRIQVAAPDSKRPKSNPEILIATDPEISQP